MLFSSRPKIGCVLILHLTPSVTSNKSAGELAWCSIRPSRSAYITSILLAERMPTFFNLHCAPMVFSGKGIVPSRVFTSPRFDQRGPNQRGKVKSQSGASKPCLPPAGEPCARGITPFLLIIKFTHTSYDTCQLQIPRPMSRLLGNLAHQNSVLCLLTSTRPGHMSRSVKEPLGIVVTLEAQVIVRLKLPKACAGAKTVKYAYSTGRSLAHQFRCRFSM